MVEPRDTAGRPARPESPRRGRPALVGAETGFLNIRPLSKGMYAVAGLIMIVPFIELAAGAWPFQPGQANWRFGTAGIVMKTLPTSLLGLGLAMAVAAVLEHRRVLRLFALLALVGGAVTAIMIAGFTLDYLQLRETVRPEFRRGVDMASLTAVVIAVLLVPTAIGLGVGGWMSSRPPRRDQESRSTGRTRALVTPHTKESTS